MEEFKRLKGFNEIQNKLIKRKRGEKVRYSDEILNEVRENSDIVEVISQYVHLKRSGRNYFGLCPVHNEKSPSYSELILKKSEIEDLENYLWFFTKNWPSLYEIADELENSGELAIGEITVSKDLLNISKEIVGASGKKVDILQSENLDVIVEVIR